MLGQVNLVMASLGAGMLNDKHRDSLRETVLHSVVGASDLGTPGVQLVASLTKDLSEFAKKQKLERIRQTEQETISTTDAAKFLESLDEDDEDEDGYGE